MREHLAGEVVDEEVAPEQRHPRVERLLYHQREEQLARRPLAERDEAAQAHLQHP
jgi:hypothetical protein